MGGVAREQDYRAIVCVPLIAGTEVLGTLNGYYRPEHEFSAEEIERLTLLANHAAIAVTSARLLDELRSLTASLREQRDALTRSEQIHQRLLAVTLRSGGIDGIATALAELVGGPVLIDDAHHQVLTGDSDALPGPDVRAAVDVDGVVDTRAGRRLRRHGLPGVCGAARRRRRSPDLVAGSVVGRDRHPGRRTRVAGRRARTAAGPHRRRGRTPAARRPGGRTAHQQWATVAAVDVAGPSCSGTT
ncbi:GAF domain-containing protein [Mycolicibacterium mageritense]|uniref:GAF domain-containing protein n=1 Tax=Mycolicibacterium mageritense TaxID=53462 RepID=UPI001E3AD6D7|nr:GAF domain-containing protein [Mycolicibacterium mageritense]MCC9186904.1 GAF domain-containing protein [Mycolicibacterium mageritense]